MYKLLPQTPGICNRVLRLSDNSYINIDADSNERQEYLKWLAEGNEPLPADE